MQTCQYVNAITIFAGCQEVWNEFCDLADDFTWGDCELSLVSQDRVLKVLDDMEAKDDGKLEQVIARIEELPENVLINMEG